MNNPISIAAKIHIKQLFVIVKGVWAQGPMGFWSGLWIQLKTQKWYLTRTTKNLILMNAGENETHILLEIPSKLYEKFLPFWDCSFDSNMRLVPMWQTVASGNSFTFWRKFQPQINKLQSTKYTDVSKIGDDIIVFFWQICKPFNLDCSGCMLYVCRMQDKILWRNSKIKLEKVDKTWRQHSCH